MAVRPEGFGPIPEVDRSDELQRLSFARLTQGLPTDKFILRDEAGHDKGVDKVLELLAGGGATNIRSQVQMKGTDSRKFNNDGSLSLPIKTSNLNYLLNGHSGLYILWIEAFDELRYIWAWDEASRLFSENADWQDQSTVTLRFSQILREGSWQAIYDRILSEGRFHRNAREVIVGAATTEPVKLAIRDTLEVTSPTQANDIICAHGINLISAGTVSIFSNRRGY